MTEKIEADDYVTIEQAAEILKVSPDMILTLIAERKLKSVSIENVEMVSRHGKHGLDGLDPNDYTGIYLVK